TRHHDLAGRVVGRLGGRAGRRRVDDPPVADPDVTDRVAAMRRVDHAPARNPRSHRSAPGDTSGSAARVRPIAPATETVPLARAPAIATRVPSPEWCSMPS